MPIQSQTTAHPLNAVVFSPARNPKFAPYGLNAFSFAFDKMLAEYESEFAA